MLTRITASWSSFSMARYTFILGFDAFATLCGLYGALLLRFGGQIPPEYARAARIAVPILVIARIGAVVGSGVHRWSFHISGLSEASRLAGAMLVASAGFVLAFTGLIPHGLPRSVYVLEFFLTLTLMTALRFTPRILETWLGEWQRRTRATTLRAVIIGAGRTGDLLARDLIGSEDGKYLLVGFVDDAATKLGVRVSGKPVLGTVTDLPKLIDRFRISTVLLAIPSLSAERVREILKLCASSRATFKTIPASYAHVDQRISAAMLHDLSPDDLLARDPIAFDAQDIRHLVHQRNVLVTGAGGTIGGEICQQLAHQGVSRLVMVDMDENELYLRLRRLQVECPSVELHAEVADIRDLERIRQLGDQYRPEFVFHAAAHKHVPLMEDAPQEAVKNNVFGTINVALMAHQAGAERLVVISTDKAVNPSSVMGATKRIAELVTQDLAQRSGTRMTAVRFGNVLGSAGSVVPLFKQQIERGGPVTVTHPDCTRYFMTVSEAVGLVLLAGLGDYGALCVLDMGKPIRIAEMAANLITMAGRVPGEEIQIVYTGLRPGEKLNEELLTGDEEQTVQVRDRISIARCPPPPPDLARRLSDLRRFADQGDREAILGAIQALVPTFHRTPGQLVMPGASLGQLDLPVTALDASPEATPGWEASHPSSTPSALAGASVESTPA